MASYFNYGIHKVAIKRDTFNTVSGKSHILQGWDESEPISSYIITTSVSDHEEIRGGSEFHMIKDVQVQYISKEASDKINEYHAESIL